MCQDGEVENKTVRPLWDGHALTAGMESGKGKNLCTLQMQAVPRTRYLGGLGLRKINERFLIKKTSTESSFAAKPDAAT